MRLECENNSQCLFDLAATNDINIALTTLNFTKEVNDVGEFLSEFTANSITKLHAVDLYVFIQSIPFLHL